MSTNFYSRNTFIAVISILSILSFQCNNKDVAALQEEVDSLKKEFNQLTLKRKLDDIQRDLKDIKKIIDSGKIPSEQDLKKIEDDLRDLKTKCDGLVDQIPDNLKNRLYACEKELKDCKKQSDDLIADQAQIKQEFQDFKSKVTNDFQKVNTDLQDKVRDAKEEAEKALDALKTNLQNQIDAANAAGASKSDLTDLSNKISQDLANAIKDLRQDLASAESKTANDLQTAKDSLQGQIDQLDAKQTTHAADLNQAKTDLGQAIKDEKERATNELGNAKKAFNASLADTETRLNQELQALKNQIPAPDTGLHASINDLRDKIDILDSALKALQQPGIAPNAGSTAQQGQIGANVTINQKVANIQAELTRIDSLRIDLGIDPDKKGNKKGFIVDLENRLDNIERQMRALLAATSHETI